MSKISFEGIGEVAATFACGDGVTAGQVVKVTGNGTVGACSDDDRFCGMALSAQDGYAAVQLAGLVRVSVTGEGVSAGWVKLAADGSGGVKAAATGGTELLVISADSDGAVVRL